MLFTTGVETGQNLERLASSVGSFACCEWRIFVVHPLCFRGVSAIYCISHFLERFGMALVALADFSHLCELAFSLGVAIRQF